MHIVSHTPNSVLVENNCPLFQTTSQMELPMTVKQFESAHRQWVNGELIQNAFSRLNDNQREFIKTGITPEQWNTIFSGEDE